MERVLVNNLDNNPYRLCYIEHSGQLLVGESCDNVKVYHISYPPTDGKNVKR